MLIKMKFKFFSLFMCFMMLVASSAVLAGQNEGSIVLNQGLGHGKLLVGEAFANRATASTYVSGPTTLAVLSTTVYAYSGSTYSSDYGYKSATANITPLTYGESVHQFEMGRSISLSCYP